MDPINRLVEALTKLPGIGEKSASRLAFHILGSPEEYARGLAQAILDVKEKIRLCSVCMNITDQDPCRLCQDPRRTEEIVCVVEEPNDLYAIEKTGSFSGKYHVLHGVISPLDGIGPDEIYVKELLERLKPGTIKEVLLATNPVVEGDATALYLKELIKPFGVKVTRIARGIAVGGDLEYTDGATLTDAIRGRQDL
ncbi:MAG: recombination mediator RecR [Thermodesulfobacteriota bacterium]